MIRHWLRLAFTHWLTHKLFAAINVLGLAVGFVCFLLILLFALLTVSLASLGLFGLVSFMVECQRKEIGVFCRQATTTGQARKLGGVWALLGVFQEATCAPSSH